MSSYPPQGLDPYDQPLRAYVDQQDAAVAAGSVPTASKGVANGVAPLDDNGDVPDANIPPGIARDSEVALTYETQAHAASTYETKTHASSTYETSSHASSTYAPLVSPALSGSPTAPTPAPGDNDTSIATTAFVAAALATSEADDLPRFTRVVAAVNTTAADGQLISTQAAGLTITMPAATAGARVGVVWSSSTAPTVVAAGTDKFFNGSGSGTFNWPTNGVINSAYVFEAAQNGIWYVTGSYNPALDTTAQLASPTFTGDPKAPTPAVNDNDTSIATTAYVIGQASSANPLVDGVAAAGTGTKWSREDHVHPTDTSRAPIASPTFTGDPKAPTPAAGDNDTSVSTTAFVNTAISSALIFQKILATQTVQVPAGMTTCEYRIVGAGGGGGAGALDTSATLTPGGGGGGGGQTVDDIATGLTPGTNLTITINAGGAGGGSAGASGANGGTTALTGAITDTARGGGGGGGASATLANTVTGGAYGQAFLSLVAGRAPGTGGQATTATGDQGGAPIPGSGGGGSGGGPATSTTIAGIGGNAGTNRQGGAATGGAGTGSNTAGNGANAAANSAAGGGGGGTAGNGGGGVAGLGGNGGTGYAILRWRP